MHIYNDITTCQSFYISKINLLYIHGFTDKNHIRYNYKLIYDYEASAAYQNIILWLLIIQARNANPIF